MFGLLLLQSVIGNSATGINALAPLAFVFLIVPLFVWKSWEKLG